MISSRYVVVAMISHDACMASYIIRDKYHFDRAGGDRQYQIDRKTKQARHETADIHKK